jgi:hypothetical protein
MNNFDNKKKKAFLKSRILANLESSGENLTLKCKFNFAYMDFSQKSGQKFEDWTHQQLIKLLNKLKDYSKESLEYWQQQRIGGGKNSMRCNVLEIYNKFPSKKISTFVHPNFVPRDVCWARFRLGNLERLIGFVIPSKFHNLMIGNKKHFFDSNTFYVVFLDKDHKFFDS